MKNLHEAILAVMSEVGYVQKEGKVKFGTTNYRYAGEADLIKALRPAMVKAGLTLIPTSIEPMQSPSGTVKAIYKFTMTHADSGESLEVSAIGEGKDQGDKASYKAATGALKYALRQTFIIETGDDPDNTSSDELVAKEKEKRKAQRKAFRVPFNEGDDPWGWLASVESHMLNADDLYALKAVFDGNKEEIEVLKGVDNSVIDQLRVTYTNRANELK